MSIEYIIPEIKDEAEKPFYFDNQRYPYGQLSSDRRFEELIYSLYKHEIDNNSFPPFDNIQILKGIKDQGRDCSLHTNGKNTGLIQCKWYANRLTKPLCIKEIIKFALYYILDNRLISNLSDFKYYFVASNGFDEEAASFLLNFNSEIATEPKLKDWATEILKKPSFLSIKDNQDIFDNLCQVLTSIKVITIDTLELDMHLSKQYNTNIIPLFFKVSTIIIHQGEKKATYSDKSIIPDSDIIKQLENASKSLSTCKNYFEGLIDSNIPREETQVLFNWIMNPVELDANKEYKNTILLAGNAGIGKTVILKDLYIKLLENNTPVLGLKADRLYVNSIKDLEERINITDSIYKILNSLKEKHSTIVLLIDQIDALSQSLSSKREYMDTYIHLIDSLKNDKQIRIILSVRIFDLHYDPSLRIYKKTKTITVAPLSDSKIDEILKKLNISKASISPELYQLFKNPNQLDVFCRINKTTNSYLGIKNVQDLYLELWKVKILNINPNSRIDVKNLTILLYQIASKMHLSQKISIPEYFFLDKYFNELNYLTTESLIKIENGQIQFFHQSFYDYVFAKQFIESGNSIISYLIKNQQSIFIRSSYKMLINYLYFYDFNKYLKLIKTILLSNRFRFHIKLLTINTIGFLEIPSSDDKLFVIKYILSHDEYKKIFFESVHSGNWLTFLIENKEIDKLLLLKKSRSDKFLEKLNFNDFKSKHRFLSSIEILPFEKKQDRNINLVYGVLIKHISSNPEIVLQYLTEIPDFKNKENIIIRLLYFLENWSIDNAFVLFEKYIEDIAADRFSYFRILENMVNYRIDYVFKELHKAIAILEKEEKKHSHDHYQIESIVKKLLNKAPELTFDFLLEIIIHQIEKNKYDGCIPELIRDSFLDGAFYHDDYEDDLRKYFKLILEKYGELAISNNPKFIEIFEKYKNSPYESILSFLILGLINAPFRYRDQSFFIIKKLGSHNALKEEGRLQYNIRKLIKASFEHFTNNQKEEILNLILCQTAIDEIYIRNNYDGKKEICSYWGRCKFIYLRCLPIDFINSNLNVKKIFLELERKKFKLSDDDKYFSRRIAVAVGAPLNNSAYGKMTLKNWYKSFLKYNSYERIHGDDFLKGNLEEHSRAFSQEVKKRPDFFIDFIENIIDDSKIHIDYVIRGIEGLKEANFNPEKTLILFKMTLIRISQGESINKNVRDNTINLVWISRYFIENKTIDSEVLNFLTNSATLHPDPNIERDMDDDKVHIGINSVRGAAAHNLTLIDSNPKFKEEIFKTLSQIALNDCNSVKAAIIYQIAYLMNLDKSRTIELFLLLMKDAHPKLYKPSIWSVQYLANHDFNRLIPYFEKAINIEEVHEDITILLFHAWVRSEKKASLLFEEVLKKSIKCKCKAIHVAFSNFYNENGNPEKKYLNIIYRFLNSNDKEISDAYALEFLRDKHVKFKDIYPFLKKFSKSIACKSPSSYFLEYLFKHSKAYPKECLKLLSNLSLNDIDDNEYSTHIHEEAVKVVIGIYNSIKNKYGTKKYTKKSLDILDKMLKQPKFRNEANKVIEIVSQ